MARKVNCTVHLDAERVARLKAISERSHVPQAVMVRDGVDLAIEKWEKRYPAPTVELRAVRGDER